MKLEKPGEKKPTRSTTEDNAVQKSVASAQVTSVASSYGLPGQTIIYTQTPATKKQR